MSTDSEESHAEFREKLGVSFTLVSDPKKEIGKLYDVRRRLGLGLSRVSYLIDKDGVVRDAYHEELRIGRHVERMLERANALQAEGS